MIKNTPVWTLWGLCVCLLPGLGGCSSEDPSVNQPKVVAKPVTKVAKPDPAKQGSLDAQGKLREAGEKVFNAPLPMATDSTSTGQGWAAYTNKHSYRTVTRFYEDKAGEEYQVSRRRGGTKLTSPDDKTDIYIAKPRRPGEPVRVYYFNHDANREPAPVVGERTAKNSTKPKRLIGESVGSGAPSAKNSRPGAGAAIIPGSDGTGADEDYYNTQTTVDDKGRKVTIFKPSAAAPLTGVDEPTTTTPRARNNPAPATPSGRTGIKVRRPLPDNFPD